MRLDKEELKYIVGGSVSTTVPTGGGSSNMAGVGAYNNLDNVNSTFGCVCKYYNGTQLSNINSEDRCSCVCSFV